MGQVRSPGGQQPKVESDPFIQKDASQGLMAGLVLGGGSPDELGIMARSQVRAPESSSTIMNT